MTANIIKRFFFRFKKYDLKGHTRSYINKAEASLFPLVTQIVNIEEKRFFYKK